MSRRTDLVNAVCREAYKAGLICDTPEWRCLKAWIREPTQLDAIVERAHAVRSLATLGGGQLALHALMRGDG